MPDPDELRFILSAFAPNKIAILDDYVREH